jgi:4-hydroxy-3-methylbut-2-enyl diphosphate reductase
MTSNGLLVVTALRSEHAALVGTGLRVERCGMGEQRAYAWVRSRGDDLPDALLIIGVAGGLDPALRATDVVVATSVQDRGNDVVLPGGAGLVAQLRRIGLTVRTGPIACSQNLRMDNAERAELHRAGALCVDMESAAIVRAWAARTPITVVRVVVDTVRAGLLHPATIPNGVRALWTIRRSAPAVRAWSDDGGTGERGTS